MEWKRKMQKEWRERRGEREREKEIERESLTKRFERDLSLLEVLL